MPQNDEQVTLRNLLSIVSAPARLALIFEIGNSTPGEIAKSLRVDPSAVSQHLSILEDAGIVTSIKRQYSLTETGKKLKDSLRSLAPIGAAIEHEKQAKARLKEENEMLEGFKKSSRIMDRKEAARILANALSKGSFKSPVVKKVKEYLEELESRT